MLIADLASTMSDIGPWVYVLLFLFTAGEASAFVGVFVPGETALLLAGYLASRGDLNLSGAIAATVVGAIVGDSIGYEIGRTFGPRLRAGWVGRLIGDERWERAHETVDRHGPKAVLIGRFVGVLRAVVPVVVGDARMPYRRFLTWNALGAVLWTPGVVLGGYFAGAAYEKVASALGWFTVVVVAVGVVGWLGWKLRKRWREPT